MPRKKVQKTPINPRNFEGMDDEYILSIVVEDKKRCETFIAPMMAKFKEYQDGYDAFIRPEDKREYGANLNIPYIYSTVETALPKLLNSIFTSKPFISYKPVYEGTQEKADYMTALIDYQFRRKIKSSVLFYEVFKDTMILGTGITKQSWRRTEKSVQKRMPIEREIELPDGTVTQVTVDAPQKVNKVTYDAPDIINIPLKDFRFDPAYSQIYDMPWCGYEYPTELWKLHEGAENKKYKNLDKISTENTQDVTTDPFASKADMRNGVKIFDYWTDEWHVVVANDNVVILVEENPYFHGCKPFTKWVMIPKPNNFYGKSTVDTLLTLSSELNTLRSQRLDNVSMAINRMFLINKQSTIDVAQLQSRPNGFIEVDDIENDIVELKMADVTSSAYSDEKIVKEDMDVTSGIHSYDRGNTPERKDTATVASLLSTASSERFKLQAIMMEESPLSDIGFQLAELNKQFITDEVFITITGQSGKEEEMVITFDDIDTELDVIAVGTAIEPSVNKEVRQSQLIQLLNTAATIPEVNKVELVKEILKVFEFKNAEDMVQEVPPEIPAEEIAPEEAGGEAQGLYPQLGGVGGLGNYLQNTSLQE